MVRMHRDVERTLPCRVDAGEPPGAGIARDVAPFVLGPDKTPGLDRQGAAQERQAEVLPLAALLAVVERGGDAVGEEGRGEIIEDRPQHDLRPLAPALEDGDPRQALQYLVEAALAGERAAVAVAGQAGIDEA